MKKHPTFGYSHRLRVVSNFGDGDCVAGEMHTRARAKYFGAPHASRLLEISRARVCVFRPPHKRSPKLETTCSLVFAVK